jgi:hypothetical protein
LDLLTISEIAMRAHTMLNLEVVIDLPFLAREINDAHRQVAFHGKSMLMEAARAGEALIAAKAGMEHGQFKAWIKANCGCSYESAKEYMRVAKHGKKVDLHLFEGGVRAFLDACATPRAEPEAKPEPKPVFTREDAEYALKILALAERGGTPAECAVAATKLERLAATFGMSSEAMVAKAKALMPDADKAPGEVKREAATARADAAEARLAKLDAITAALKKRLAKTSRDELIEMLASVMMRLEEAGLS